MPVILVTGANGGIARVTIGEFLVNGHTVIAQCRTQEKFDDLKAELSGVVPDQLGNLVPAIFDLSVIESTLGWARGYGWEVDCVYCNAAPEGLDAVEPEYTGDLLEVHFAVNAVCHVALVHALRAKLAASPDPRVVFTSAAFHDPGNLLGKLPPHSHLDLGAAWDPASKRMAPDLAAGSFQVVKAFKDAKACSVLLGAEVARRLPGVFSASFHPGVVPETHSASLTKLFLSVGGKALGIVGMRPMQEAAGLAYNLLLGRKENLTCGAYYGNAPLYKVDIASPVDPSPQAADPQIASQLWDICTEIVKHRGGAAAADLFS